MARQRIQLRGISRTPSDRMSADGGVAESVNFRTDGSEFAPAAAARDVTASETGAAGEIRPVYIHDTGTGHNHIGVLADDDGLFKVYACSDGVWGESPVVSLDNGEELTGVRSLGNILLLTTPARTLYVLRSDAGYRYLGDSIPAPSVEFITEKVEQTDITSTMGSLLGEGSDLAKAASILYSQGVSDFNSMMERYGTAAEYTTESQSVAVTDIVNSVNAGVWALISNRRASVRKDGVFIRPVLARYAVRLYEGTCLNASAPVLLGAGLADIPFHVTFEPASFPTPTDGTWTVKMRGCYRCRAVVSFPDDGWKDIVQSVEIFLSTDVAYPPDNALLNRKSGVQILEFKQKGTLEDELLSKTNFYVAETVGFPVDGSVSRALEPVSQDDLVVRRRLTDTFRSGHGTSPVSGLMEYNGRMLGCGLRETLPRGHAFHPSALHEKAATAAEPSFPERFKFRYHIRDGNGQEKTVLAFWGHSGDAVFRTGWAEKTDSGYDAYTASAFAFITYPDSRCFSVDVINLTGGTVTTFQMKEHPGLECAYWFGGSIATPLASLVADGTALSGAESSEDRVTEERNRLLMSEVDNPFRYPAGGRITFGAAVIAAATTTVALSSGQYDTAPVYVFTEAGIEALRINADGSFGTHSYVSRDVAEAGSVCPVDRAVLFSSDRGAMLLEGAAVSCISENLRGRGYTMEPDAVDIISRTPWAGLLGCGAAPESILDFLAGARYVYDYAGHRIVVFRAGADWQYVYGLDSKTWHKYDAGLEFAGELNSYPRALVAVVAGARAVSFLRITDMTSGQVTPDDVKASLKALGLGLTDAQLADVVSGLRKLRMSDYPEDVQASVLAVLDDDTVRAEYERSEEKVKTYGVCDFSTLPDEDGTSATEALSVTRPFDLDAPDVRKQISRIEIRGNFRKGSVHYVLMGSMDGRNFTVLPSLRSGSFKSYRLAVLASLLPRERISWIDVEFEPRFTGRMR